jgi:hypothetical protein
MTRLLPLLLLLTTATYGQNINTTTQGGQKNIYNDAIKHYISFVSRSDKSIFDTLLVLKDDNITDSLLTKIQNSQIIILDSTEISNRLKSDKSFIAHKIFPINYDNGHFYINIIPFRVYKKTDEVIFENSGTCVVSYIYESSKRRFTFYRAACNGLRKAAYNRRFGNMAGRRIYAQLFVC